MIHIGWTPALADVVFLPRWTDILPAVLIAAVVLLAAGLLAYFIGKNVRHRKKKEDKK